MRLTIALGIFSFLVLVIIVGFIAATEQDRMESFTQSYQSRQIETGAALFENNCRSCHGPQGRGIDSVAPSINAADLFNGERLQAIGFAGTVENYVRGVISAGRPVQSEGAAYPQRMPTWGMDNGGPMRVDQIDSLVTFIMNWEEVALGRGDDQPDTGTPVDGVGTDITIALPSGDPEVGEELIGGLGCTACHTLAPLGPAWAAEGDIPGIATRAESRIAQDDYTGEAADAVQYLIESVVLSEAFVVEGYAPGLMPSNYAGRLSLQDLADVIAYMQTFQ